LFKLEIDLTSPNPSIIPVNIASNNEMNEQVRIKFR
jgi:hypothetical protein